MSDDSVHATYRLVLLGGLRLLDRDGEPVDGLSARRLTLLATLAAAGPEGLARDTVLLLFWPESTRDRARNALHQAVHSIRAVLGVEAINTRRFDIRVNSRIVSHDVAEFEDAATRADWSRAMDLYAGPFLDLIELGRLPELQRWVGETRERLDAAYRTAVRETTMPVPANAAEFLDASTNGDAGPVSSALSRVLIGCLVCGFALAVVMLLRILSPRESILEPAGAYRRVIIAMPHNLTRDSSLNAIGEIAQQRMVEGLTNSFPRVDVTVSAPKDTSSGITRVRPSSSEPTRMVVRGTYAWISDTLRLMVTAVETPGEKAITARTVNVGTRSAPLAFVGSATDAALGAIAVALDPHAPGLARISTPPTSLIAYREYQAGIRAFNEAWDSESALEHFGRAWRLDSTFYRAAVYVGWTYRAIGDWGHAATTSAWLAEHKGDMLPGEALNAEMLAANLAGDHERNVGLARRIDVSLTSRPAVVSLSSRLQLAGRLHEALHVLTPLIEAKAHARPGRSTVFWVFATQLHDLGRYDRELAVSDEREAAGEVLWSDYWIRLGALAALRRVNEVLRLVDDPPRPELPYRLEYGRRVLTLASEFAFHGHPELVGGVTRRMLPWCSDTATARTPLQHHEQGVQCARALFLLKDPRSAAPFARRAVASALDEIDRLGLEGVFAAWAGDSARAVRTRAALASASDVVRLGRQDLWMAKISAVLRDDEAALTELEAARRNGWTPFDWDHERLHSEVEFIPLMRYPRFLALARSAD